MRYSAPPHASDITLSSGPVEVVDGFVEVPDDRTEGDHAGLVANGFHPAYEVELADGLDLTVAKLREIATLEDVDLTGLTIRTDIQAAIRAKRAIALGGD